MKRFPSIAVFLFVCCILFLSVTTIQAADLSFKIMSAAVVEEVKTDLGLMDTGGILLQIQVTNSGDETKLWASDFAVGVHNGTEELRISGLYITNAVSDPEDDMNFRYFQGTAVRKGTRYFEVLFSEFMNWELSEGLSDLEINEGILYFRTPVTGKFPIIPLEAE